MVFVAMPDAVTAPGRQMHVMRKAEMIRYVKAARRPSIRFNNPTESIIYSLTPDTASTVQEIVDLVHARMEIHPEDGASQGVHELRLATQNLIAAGWLRPA